MITDAFLKSLTTRFTPLIPEVFQEDYLPIDLSVTNKDLTLEVLQDPQQHEAWINTRLRQNEKKVAYGGYLEERGLYDRSDYFQEDQPGDKRNIHLGIDLWSTEGTAIMSPLPGKVHSFKNNTNFGDYGPTLIIEHKLEGYTFHTLYGHLSPKSLYTKKIGMEVKAGEIIAWLGTPEINGEYAPHLHFQIVIDMEKKKGDYPGVSSYLYLEFYKGNCPDPNLLLKIY